MIEVSPTPHNSIHLGGDPPVVVVGFSVRALAEATSQINPSIVAVDHFADHDLRAIATNCLQIDRWGSRLNVAEDRSHVATIIRQLAPFQASYSSKRVPLLICGGIENWPVLLEAINARYRVLGPSSVQMQDLRNLEFWRTAAERSGISFPETVCDGAHDTSTPLPEAAGRGKSSSLYSTNRSASGTYWLRKSVQGAGGLHIDRVENRERLGASRRCHAGASNAMHYFQREISGRSLGVTCILRDRHSTDRTCTVLGATESFGLRDWHGPSEFIYRGSWGPVPLSSEQSEQITRLGETIHAKTGLVGWLQADFIEDRTGQLWLLELNPRWTAGMEILFQAGLNPVAHHFDAWNLALSNIHSPMNAPLTDPSVVSDNAVFGKAIVYAAHDIYLTESLVKQLQNLPSASVADIPSSESIGQTILAGHPLLTVRAQVDRNPANQDETKARLLQTLVQRSNNKA